MRSNQHKNYKIHTPHKASTFCFIADLVAILPYNWRGYARPHQRHTIRANQSWVTKKKLPLVCLGISSESTYTHTHQFQRTHTLSLSLFHPSASICSQAVATFWWISQAYSLAQVDTGADYFSMNPSSLPSACIVGTIKKTATILSLLLHWNSQRNVVHANI